MNMKNLKQLLCLPNKEYELFQKKTNITQFNTVTRNKAWKIVQFKSYSRLPETILPKTRINKNSLIKAFYERKSSRDFQSVLLKIEDLSTVLFFSAGMKNNRPPWIANRFYPSAGARYPLETYLISLNTSLEKGIYHYYLKNHSLEKLSNVDTGILSSAFGPDWKWISKSSCLIIVTALFKRNTMKYGDRGLRYIYIEAGHMAQNASLISSYLGLQCCCIGGFADDILNALVDIEAVNESVLYALAIGPKS